MSRGADLMAFVRRHEGVRVTWGLDDCSAICARWMSEACGFAPALPPYRSREEAARLIDASGGLVACWRGALRSLDLAETDLPGIGDVGVVETEHFGAVGMIMGANGYAFWRARAGFQLMRPRSWLAAWTLP